MGEQGGQPWKPRSTTGGKFPNVRTWSAEPPPAPQLVSMQSSLKSKLFLLLIALGLAVVSVRADDTAAPATAPAAGSEATPPESETPSKKSKGTGKKKSHDSEKKKSSEAESESSTEMKSE